MARHVVERLNSEIRAVLADPETKKHVVALGGDIYPSTPEAMRDRVLGEITKWRRIVTERRIEVK
jgi:tripartite-type tricarboxylate transporter receptor subunit TctC